MYLLNFVQCLINDYDQLITQHKWDDFELRDWTWHQDGQIWDNQDIW